MIRQDYFVRVIREFFEALQLVINSKESIRQKKDRIAKLYDSYIGDSIFYHTASLEDVMDSFTQWREEERLPKMEMLARLYFVEADFSTALDKQMMQERALMLFRFIDRHSTTFSMERQRQIEKLEKALKKKED
ncbi:MAG: hypothetical protein PUH24_00345 [Prevotellaceae bacterium]|nr:hypothetical protein [Prevotellaceae bacterium]MDY6130769.1 hypothetical protein [Prevotella sp.]